MIADDFAAIALDAGPDEAPAMTLRNQLSHAGTVEERCDACATLRRQIRWFSPTSIFDLANQARQSVCPEHKGALALHNAGVGKEVTNG